MLDEVSIAEAPWFPSGRDWPYRQGPGRRGTCTLAVARCRLFADTYYSELTPASSPWRHVLFVATVRPGEDGVEIQLADLWEVIGEPGDPQQRVGERGGVRRRRAQVAGEQRRGVHRIDHLVGVGFLAGLKPVQLWNPRQRALRQAAPPVLIPRCGDKPARLLAGFCLDGRARRICGGPRQLSVLSTAVAPILWFPLASTVTFRPPGRTREHPGRLPWSGSCAGCRSRIRPTCSSRGEASCQGRGGGSLQRATRGPAGRVRQRRPGSARPAAPATKQPRTCHRNTVFHV